MKIIPVGGYGEIGGNSVIIDLGTDAIMLDLGLNMEKYIELTEDESIGPIAMKDLLERNAAPRIDKLPKKLLEKIRAIIPSHAHLDHVGAIPFIASRIPADIYGTPFTIEFLKTVLREEGISLPNNIYSVNTGKEFYITKDISIELIHVTHSTPHSSMIAVHTPEGTVLYANDYKIDNAPLLGKKTDLKRIKKLAPIKVLISESLYADTPGKTPSERIARELLRDVILGLKSEDRAVVMTTFSSHISRIKTMLELGEKTGRKIAILGRSMSKYLGVADTLGIYKLPKNVKVLKYRSEINQFLKKIKSINEYLLIVTGNQGEPKAVLSRMADGLFPFTRNDMVLFSCKVIPANPSITNRQILESKLRNKKVRIFTDLHVSGHAYREDLRELMIYTEPEITIPSHSNMEKQLAYKELVEETMDSRVEIVKNFDIVKC